MGIQYPPRLKYWMPIHYDTIEDGQNKKSHLLFSFLVRIAILSGDLFVKNIITSFHWFHLNNYTPYENKYFNPRNQIHRMAFITRINSVCVQMRHAIRGVKYATTPRYCWTRYPPRCINGWAEFWSEPMKILVDKLNHAHWLRISLITPQLVQSTHFTF